VPFQLQDEVAVPSPTLYAQVPTKFGATFPDVVATVDDVDDVVDAVVPIVYGMHTMFAPEYP
jgi:hypothetical protein